MKLKILASLIAIGMTLGWQIEAQTNVATIVTTNWLTAVPYYREVNGQLYNTERSTLWKEFQADVLDISTNGLLLQTYTFKPVYEASTTSILSPSQKAAATPPATLNCFVKPAIEPKVI